MSTPHARSTKSISRPLHLHQIARVALLAITTAIALPTHATVIVDNFNPDGGFTPTGPILALHRYIGIEQYAKSAFSFTVLGGDYYLDTVTLALRHFYTNPQNNPNFASPYTLSIYGNTNNRPGEMLESISNASTPNSSTFIATAFDFSGSTKLLDGQTYWIVSTLAESNPIPLPTTTTAQDIYTISQNTTGSTTPLITQLYSPGQATNWATRTPLNSRIAFRIEGTAVTAPVPEPETYAMLLAGLGVVGMMGRRRNSKKAT